ncbi:winged-helix domain-containing protein [uncultured Ruminococcus sp.]|nr:winged-helix domain-containing protein [uncultured Ruminococcus sp.]
MKEPICSKATLSRLPLYLDYLRTERPGETISAAEISRALGLGDVQVKKT